MRAPLRSLASRSSASLAAERRGSAMIQSPVAGGAGQGGRGGKKGGGGADPPGAPHPRPGGGDQGDPPNFPRARARRPQRRGPLRMGGDKHRENVAPPP